MNLPKSRWLLLAVILDLPIIARLLWIQARLLTISEQHLGRWTRLDVALSVLFILTGLWGVKLALKASPAGLLFWNLCTIAILLAPFWTQPNRWNFVPIVYFEVGGAVMAAIAIGVWQIQSRQRTARLSTPAASA
jgi:hypothetical protein